MNFRTVRDFDLKGQNVLVRFDYNVPMQDGRITDNTRIKSTLPTIQYIAENGGRTLILSHMGRPKGERKPEYSLKTVREELAELLGREVFFFDDVLEKGLNEKISKLPDNAVVLFENVRYYKQETEGNAQFAQQISELGDIYINDGFAVSHRKHASVYGVPMLFKDKGAGLLLEQEIKHLGSLVSDPEKPYIFLIGGAKISTKLDVIMNTLKYASTVLIGGAMAFSFLKAMGFSTGKSLVEDDMLDHCRKIMKKAEELNVNVILPVDFAAAKDIDGEGSEVKNRAEMAEDDIGLDIGPLSVEIFSSAISTARTLAFNGPMGMFENPRFADGTRGVLEAIDKATKAGCISVTGGGDSIAALNALGSADYVSFISTGGGAMLEMLSGLDLPGISVLEEK